MVRVGRAAPRAGSGDFAERWAFGLSGRGLCAGVAVVILVLHWLTL